MFKFQVIERMWIVDVVQNSWRVCSYNLMLSMVLLFSLGFNYTSHRLWRLYLQCVSDYSFEMLETSSYKMRNLWETCLIFRRRNEHLGNLALMPYLLSKGIHHHYSVLPLSIIQWVGFEILFKVVFIRFFGKQSKFDTS